MAILLPLAILLGIGLLATGATARRRAPARPPRELPAGGAARIREGEPTAEDLEAAADQADDRGMPAEAQRIRERAAETPTAEDVAEARAPGETYEDELTRVGDARRAAIRAILSLTNARDAEHIAQIRRSADRIAEGGFPLIAERLRRHASHLETQPFTPLPSREPVREPVLKPPTRPREIPTGRPAGFNPAKARMLASKVARDIAEKRYGYNRTMLRDFQRYAGIAQDSIYGGGSRGALIYYGVANPPRPLMRPTATQPYPSHLAEAATAGFSW